MRCAMSLRLAPGLRAWPRLHEKGANMQLWLGFLAVKASRACAWFDAAGTSGRSALRFGEM